MNRTEFIRFRVTPKEKASITQKAMVTYRRAGAYARDVALENPVVSMKELDDVARELRRIGQNLNQLTVLVRQGRIQAFTLDETREEVAKLWQSVNSFLQNLQ